MSSQVRAGRFKGVENRGVTDMPRSGESLRFVDQQNRYTTCEYVSDLFCSLNTNQNLKGRDFLFFVIFIMYIRWILNITDKFLFSNLNFYFSKKIEV